jgi:hypothetical protein
VPSHRVHRLCGALVGLPEDIVAFVDELIDSGRCGAHDVARFTRCDLHRHARCYAVSRSRS